MHRTFFLIRAFYYAAALSAAALLTIGLLGGCTASPAPGVDAKGELSYDGLTPLKNTRMTRVWVRENVTLAGYRQIILDGVDIRYRPVTRSTTAGRKSSAQEFPITAEQKATLERLINEEFKRAAARLTLPQVSEPGPDVLLLRGYMLDVVSRIPPDRASRSHYFIDSVGQATFVVELIDSQTGTVLARALDTRSARTPGASFHSNRATNQAQVRRLIARWADLLADALNDLTTIENLQGTDS